MISLNIKRLVFQGVLVVLGMASPAWSCGGMVFPSSLLCSSPSVGGTLGYPSLKITLVMPARASWGYDKPISFPPQLTPRSSTPAPATYPGTGYPSYYGSGFGYSPYGMGAWNPYAYSSPTQWMPSGYYGAPSVCGGSAFSGGSLLGGGGLLGCGTGYGTVLPYGNTSGLGSSTCSSCGAGNGSFGWGGGNYMLPNYTLLPSYAGMGSSCGSALNHQCGGGGMSVVNPRPVCVIASCSPRYLLRPILRAKTERSRRFY